MNFIDLLYLTCSNFYMKREKDMFKINGLILLVGVFLSNLIMVSLLIDNLVFEQYDAKVYDYRYYIVVSIMIILGLTFYTRYFKVTNYDELANKFESMTNKTKIIARISTIVYIFSSFSVTLFYALNSYYKWW